MKDKGKERGQIYSGGTGIRSFSLSLYSFVHDPKHPPPLPPPKYIKLNMFNYVNPIQAESCCLHQHLPTPFVFQKLRCSSQFLKHYNMSAEIISILINIINSLLSHQLKCYTSFLPVPRNGRGQPNPYLLRG